MSQHAIFYPLLRVATACLSQPCCLPLFPAPGHQRYSLIFFLSQHMYSSEGYVIDFRPVCLPIYFLSSVCVSLKVFFQYYLINRITILVYLKWMFPVFTKANYFYRCMIIYYMFLAGLLIFVWCSSLFYVFVLVYAFIVYDDWRFSFLIIALRSISINLLHLLLTIIYLPRH